MSARLAVPVNDDDHAQGSASAPVTLVEYGDFQCPSCGVAYPIVKQLQKHFGEDLRFVHRSFPLPMHRYTEQAAETAEFAASEDKFWEMHDALYENQASMDSDLFPELADELGLNTHALEEAIEHGDFTARVEQDIEGGQACGVHATPTFFINGVQHSARDYESLKEAIRAAKA